MTSVWITGAKGFIGSHLSKYLALRGCSVYGLGHGIWPEDEVIKGGLVYWQNGEIETSNLHRLLDKSGPPDTIYHLAGGNAVGPSFISPLEDFRRTVDSTACVLDWARKNNPDSRIICVSSAAVYGTGHKAEVNEEIPLFPCSPYGFHKLIMEDLCQSYIRNFGAKIGIVRLFSVYGNGLEKQLIWDICGQLKSGPSTLMLGGTGNEIRDWIHISDAVQLLWLARDIGESSNPIINGGMGIGTSVRDIAIMICKEWDSSAGLDFSGQKRSGDPEVLIADINRAKSLGFNSSKTLVDGIREFVRWYKTRMDCS